MVFVLITTNRGKSEKLNVTCIIFRLCLCTIPVTHTDFEHVLINPDICDHSASWLHKSERKARYITRNNLLVLFDARQAPLPQRLPPLSTISADVWTPCALPYWLVRHKLWCRSHVAVKMGYALGELWRSFLREMMRSELVVKMCRSRLSVLRLFLFGVLGWLRFSKTSNTSSRCLFQII